MKVGSCRECAARQGANAPDVSLPCSVTCDIEGSSRAIEIQLAHLVLRVAAPIRGTCGERVASDACEMVAGGQRSGYAAVLQAGVICARARAAARSQHARQHETGCAITYRGVQVL
jgi:hypothetical protein